MRERGPSAPWLAAPLLGASAAAPWLGGAPAARRPTQRRPCLACGGLGGALARRPSWAAPWRPGWVAPLLGGRRPRHQEAHAAATLLGALACDTPARHPHGGALVVREGLGEGAYAHAAACRVLNLQHRPLHPRTHPRTTGGASWQPDLWRPGLAEAPPTTVRSTMEGAPPSMYYKGNNVFLSSFNGHSNSRLTE